MNIGKTKYAKGQSPANWIFDLLVISQVFRDACATRLSPGLFDELRTNREKLPQMS